MNTQKEVLPQDDLPKTTTFDLPENAASTSNIQSTNNDEPSDASKPRRRRKFVGTKSTKTFASSQLASSPPAFPSSPALTSALSILPSNYTFEVSKTIAMIRKHDIKTVGLQMPEGLQMYACVVADLLTRFAYSDTGEESNTELEVVILGDVTYGACCVDDYTARALGVELLVHYGHSCLVPLSTTAGIRTLYVFVEIAIDLKHAEDTVRANLPNGRGRFTEFIGALEGKRAGDKIGGGGYLTIRADDGGEGQREGTEDPAMRIALVSTIQFATALSALRDALSLSGYHTILPRAHPLSPGEILGCTAPSLPADDQADAILYLGDGRFHLEAMMLANPDVPAFRYDPYSKKLTREGYDHVGMRAVRRRAVGEARTTLKTGGMWGIILGTLGRQGNTGHLDALMNMPKSSPALPILLSELSPSKLALFSPHIDVFVQTSCPRLSIDWGAAFERPLLSVYEAGVACGVWEWGGEIGATKEDGAHPMDFYKRGSRWAEARQTGRLTSL